MREFHLQTAVNIRSLWRSLLGSLASNQWKKKTRKQISSACLSDYLGTYLGFIILLVPEYALPKISSNSTVSAEFSLHTWCGFHVPVTLRVNSPLFLSQILESNGRLLECGRVFGPSYFFSGKKAFLKREMLLSFLKRQSLDSLSWCPLDSALWDPVAGVSVVSSSPGAAQAVPVPWQPQNSNVAQQDLSEKTRNSPSHLTSHILNRFQKFKWVIRSTVLYL